jgi:putative ABC transport system permease protein
MLSALLQDLRYAARALRLTPGFTSAAVLVLGIGIGANTAIFSLIDAALLRPLPYADPDRLFMLWEVPPDHDRNAVAPLNYVDWSEQSRAFAAIAAVSGASGTLTGTGATAEKISGQSVSTNFFDVLGIRPIAGRTFRADDATEKAHVVVISERLWQRRFGSDPAVVGRTLSIDGNPLTVIGIVPADFAFLGDDREMWLPWLPNRAPEQRRMHYLRVVGRLRPGVTIEQARADMAGIAAHIAEISPDTNKNWGIRIDPLRDQIVGRQLRLTSLVLAGVVISVLLMACANVASLLLARGIGRAREVAVRAALGASRARILRQLLIESVLLALIAGTCGLLVAWIIVRATPLFLPPGTLPASVRLALDLRGAIFTLALTLATGILFGLAPAWQAMRAPVAQVLGAAGGRGVAGGAGALRRTLVIAELAVAVLLASGAGLLVRTLLSLGRVDPGYHAANVLTMEVGLPQSRYPTPDRRLRFYEDVQRQLAALPGVRAASIGTSVPLAGWDIGMGFHVIGDAPVDPSHTPSAHYQMIGPRYFDALGIPLRAGRAFTDADTIRSTPVCIVNDAFVREYARGRDPIGMHVTVSALGEKGPEDVVREIVGVSAQVKVEGLDEMKDAIEIYVPIAQNAWFWGTFVVRTDGDPIAIAGAARAVVARVDKNEAVTRVRTMDDVLMRSTAQPRFRAQLVGSFAALALLLAAVGIFGVLAFAVGQRTREFGIRMALGARATDVLRLVLGSGLRLAATGIAIGLAASALLTRSLSSLLFAVTPLDPLTFTLAAALLAAVAVAACLAPALRAARVDPAVALRQE